MDLGLAGKVVLVTGGSGGIGRGIVLEFVREGARVVSADIDASDALVNAAKEQGLAGEVVEFACDITRKESVAELMDKIHERFGPVEVLVNNAGGNKLGGVTMDIDNDEHRRYNVALNMDGLMNVTFAVAKDMMASGKGAIVNISSNASLSGVAAKGVVHYGGMKGFVNSFGRGLAVEWADYGIRVNTIAPGLIVPHKSEHITGARSRWNRADIRGKAEEIAQDMDGVMLKNSGSVLQRVGRPEDIANLAMFFASDKAAYITGQIVSVSGGGVMP